MVRKFLMGAALVAATLPAFAAQSWNTTTSTSAAFSGDESSSFTFTLDGTANVFSFAGSSSDLAAVYLGSTALTKLLDSPDFWSTNISNLAAGTYTLSVYVAPTFNAHVDTFSGTVSVTGAQIATGAVAAVPEPETYAMFGVGLAAMGFLARRRKFS